MADKTHWEQVYNTKAVDGVSWYQPRAELSLQLIASAGLAGDAPIIDVGGGASTLVDDLLAQGHAALTVLDLSGAALKKSQLRLGDKAQAVRWLEGDITQIQLPQQAYALWHDRAVFHFLTTAAQRQRYMAQLHLALQEQGHVVMATFAQDGPEKCSGLPVARYSADALCAEFGPSFELLAQHDEVHPTPFGTQQKFVYCHLRKRGEVRL